MIVSLNEIEVNLRKAAIGAGLPLGLAEDLGRAAAWLSVFELSAVPLCLSALDGLLAGSAARPLLEEREAGNWLLRSDSDAPLSSLYAGPAAGDLLLAAATEGRLPAKLRLDPTDSPLLVLAAVCDLLALRGEVTMDCSCILPDSDVQIARFQQGDVVFSQDPQQLPLDCVLLLRLSASEGKGTASSGQDFFTCQERAAELGVTVEAADWKSVQKLAAETLVPASELSRLQGAGAGLQDND